MSGITHEDTDKHMEPCPFCGSEFTFLSTAEPRGHWGGGYHPQYALLFGSCKQCKTEGPKVECKHFNSWNTKYTVQDYRDGGDLWEQEQAKWKIYEESCKNKAIVAWNKRGGTDATT